MRRISIPSPFASGYRSDAPDYALSTGEASFAQDMFAPLGSARQRYGWKYVFDQVGAFDLVGVGRAIYTLPATNNIVASRSDGKLYAHPASGAGVEIWSNPKATATTWLPRCFYNGDLIFCAQDGVSPVLRYGGSTTTTTTTVSSATVSMSANGMTFTVGTSAAATVGSFISVRPPSATAGTLAKQPAITTRILATNGTTTFTTENLRNPSASAAPTSSTTNSTYVVAPIGFAFPAVDVYSTGTVSSVSGTTVNFDGANFTGSEVTINTTAFQGDALLIENAGGSAFQMADITSVTDADTLVTSVALTELKYRYHIMRRCPFKDMTVHKGSVWGTGVKQYPNRVYVLDIGRDIGIPPAAIDPYDPTTQAGYATSGVTGFTRVSDYSWNSDGLDIPSKYDKTPVVALLSTNGPLLVLKPDAVYGIFGTFRSTAPSLEVQRVSEGHGCIDIRSAITYESTPYWAGADGIYTYRDGAIIDLSRDKISKEWQGLMLGYVVGTSVVSCGVVAGTHLVVAVSGLTESLTGNAKNGPDASNPTSRTLVYDLRMNVWLGRVSNFTPVSMWQTYVESGGKALLAVDKAGHQGRVIDFYPALTDGIASDGDAVYPRMKAWSSASMAQAEGVEGEARLCDVTFHVNLYDETTPTSVFDVSVVSGGSINSKANSTKTLDAITADATNRVDRFKRRVNRAGRLHQIRVDMSTTDSSNKNSEIPEIVMSFRDTRRGT